MIEPFWVAIGLHGNEFIIASCQLNRQDAFRNAQQHLPPNTPILVVDFTQSPAMTTIRMRNWMLYHGVPESMIAENIRQFALTVKKMLDDIAREKGFIP